MPYMPVRKKDTERALGLLEDYCSKLIKPEEQQLKTAIQRVMGIFNSSLFQALLDIQEFYEVTLLDARKSGRQRLEEVNHTARRWERTASSARPLRPDAGPAEKMREPGSSEPGGKEKSEESVPTNDNRPPAVQGSPPSGPPPQCMNPALMNAPWQYRYQDEDSPPQDHGFPRLTNEARAPELVHVSEKNLSEIENVHGYVSHSHISPLKPALVTRFDLAYPGVTAANYLASFVFFIRGESCLCLFSPPFSCGVRTR
ncbi:disks large homolog 1-like [Osmerus eperlanus]|uniref:disks large homolog 1-like n=1 Tax=Osmerus eperlanus TaxID=29151 RepID=UPI002E109CBC